MKISYQASALAQQPSPTTDLDDGELLALTPYERRLRIAVLDDDQVFLKVIERYARQLDISVTTATTVSSMAEIVASAKFDAVVLDYYLDADTGSDVADSIHGMPIVLTSRKSDWLREPNISPRVSAFVHKKYGAKVVLEKAMDLARKARGKEVS